MTDLRRARARSLLGYLRPEHMPAWAVTALLDGLDSPSLAMLAGHPPGDVRILHDLFESAMDELGAPNMSAEDAWWEMVRACAEAAVAGSISPIDAAHEIWYFWGELDRPDALTGFVHAASEWDDQPDHRDYYERMALEEARLLLRSWPGSADS